MPRKKEKQPLNAAALGFGNGFDLKTRFELYLGVAVDHTPVRVCYLAYSCPGLYPGG